MAESVTVKEGYYDKIGITHCGVILGFKVTCGPEMKVLDEGEEFYFERSDIKAKRENGEVVFTKE